MMSLSPSSVMRNHHLLHPRSALGIALIALSLAASAAVDPQDAAWQAALDANIVAGYRAYLDEFPKGRHASVARVKLAILQAGAATTAPPAENGVTSTANEPKGRWSVGAATANATAPRVRPALPFTLPEDVWQTIERSEMYRHLPRPRAYERSFSATERTTLPTMVVTTITKNHKRYSPLAGAPNGYYESVESFQTSASNNQDHRQTVNRSSISNFGLGMLTLGSLADGAPLYQIQRIHRLEGSLFPLRAGNQLRIDYEYANVRYEIACQVTGPLASYQERPELAGKAWSVRCEHKNSFNSAASTINDTVFIEDLGLFRDEFGVFDLSQKKMVVPPGATYQYTFGLSTTSIDGYSIQIKN